MQTVNTKFCLVFKYVRERIKVIPEGNKRGFKHLGNVLFLLLHMGTSGIVIFFETYFYSQLFKKKTEE